MSKGKNYTVQQFVDGLKKLMKNDSSVANSPLYILTNNNVSSVNYPRSKDRWACMKQRTSPR